MAQGATPLWMGRKKETKIGKQREMEGGAGRGGGPIFDPTAGVKKSHCTSLYKALLHISPFLLNLATVGTSNSVQTRLCGRQLFISCFCECQKIRKKLHNSKIFNEGQIVRK